MLRLRSRQREEITTPDPVRQELGQRELFWEAEAGRAGRTGRAGAEWTCLRREGKDVRFQHQN